MAIRAPLLNVMTWTAEPAMFLYSGAAVEDGGDVARTARGRLARSLLARPRVGQVGVVSHLEPKLVHAEGNNRRQ